MLKKRTQRDWHVPRRLNGRGHYIKSSGFHRLDFSVSQVKFIAAASVVVALIPPMHSVAVRKRKYWHKWFHIVAHVCITRTTIDGVRERSITRRNQTILRCIPYIHDVRFFALFCFLCCIFVFNLYRMGHCVAANEYLQSASSSNVCVCECRWMCGSMCEGADTTIVECIDTRANRIA